VNSPLAIYQQLVDDLREARRQPGWKPEDDRAALGSLEDLYETLTDEEREVVERESERSWPDLWDARGDHETVSVAAFRADAPGVMSRMSAGACLTVADTDGQPRMHVLRQAGD